MNRLMIVMIIIFSMCSNCSADDYYFPVDISGKLLNEDGSTFTMPVTVVVVTTSSFVGKEIIVPVDEENRINVTNGTFVWKGQTQTTARITAEKEGYYSTEAVAFDYKKLKETTAKDIQVYMIPKGTPTSLEYTERAFIPDTEDEESKGKHCGWSFSKRWYFPVDEEAVDITLGINEKGQYYYRMKSPGGFVSFPGFLQFESNPKKVDNKIEYLHEAPETGYVEDFILADYPATIQGENFCYFKTPDGKYGKAKFRGAGFNYYIQPDGSRNLELGKKIYKNPIRPEKRY